MSESVINEVAAELVIEDTRPDGRPSAREKYGAWAECEECGALWQAFGEIA